MTTRLRLPGEQVVLEDAEAVAEEAARRFAAAAARAMGERGRFSVAFSGGSTPRLLYERLAREPYLGRIDWPRVDVLFGDERTVPPDHKDSNYGMARAALLSRVPAHVERMEGERPPEEAARDYDAVLRRVLGEPARVDLQLLGMGPDGHTASLFPHTAALDEKERLVVANRVEKLHTWRITTTLPFVNAARATLVLIAGAEKAEVLRALQAQPPPDPREHPILFVRPSPGTLTWLLDQAAVS